MPSGLLTLYQILPQSKWSRSDVGASDRVSFIGLQQPVIAPCHVELGFDTASDDDLMLARELAAGLIGESIATLETSRTMRALHPISLVSSCSEEFTSSMETPSLLSTRLPR
jgi:hypothetical protein